MKDQQFVLNFLHDKVKQKPDSKDTLIELEDLLRKELAEDVPFKMEELASIFCMRSPKITSKAILRNVKRAGIPEKELYCSKDIERAYLSFMKSILPGELSTFVKSLQPKFPISSNRAYKVLYYRSQEDIFGRTTFPVEEILDFFKEPNSYLARLKSRN